MASVEGKKIDSVYRNLLKLFPHSPSFLLLTAALYNQIFMGNLVDDIVTFSARSD